MTQAAAQWKTIPMSASNHNERRNGDGNQCPLLRITGTHSPDGFDVEIWGRPEIVTFNVFEYLLELIAKAYEDPEGYLYNIKSISCSRPRRDGDIDVDGTAHDRRRHLIKILREGVETGYKSYRLSPWLGEPEVSKSILQNPYLDSQILDRLRRAMPPEK
jgi:hypothetical protein